MRKIIPLLLACALLLGGCASGQMKKYTATYLDLFDTVTTVVGMANDEASFQHQALAIHDQLLEYHQLFDIYNTYPGLANLKTVNDSAGIAPVRVDSRILQLLSDCKEFYAATGGKVNVAMGSVLQLWHDQRTQALEEPAAAALPDGAALAEAALHCDITQVILDENASTVYLADPALRLDVGAVAKGWAVAQVAKTAPDGLLLNVGGNICATGAKDAQGNPWVVGVQDPDDSGNYLQKLQIRDLSVVTSGDYQRCYRVDGESYHHIIDPQTHYPAKLWRSVTVICPDSGVADALSTALFLMPRQQGQQLLDRFDAHAMWVDGQGQIFYSPGFRDFL